MREPLPPHVIERRRRECDDFVTEDIRLALDLFPAIESWKEAHIEINRIQMTANTEESQGGHIA